MKKLIASSVIAFALSVAVPVWGDASATGCLHSDGRAAGCSTDPAAVTTPTAVPEPGTILLLGSGLAGVCGFALLKKKKASQVA